MGTLSYDFTTQSAEAPISFGGAFEVLYGTAGTQAPQLQDNGGQINASPNNTSAPAAVGITSGTATFGQKQYAEITVGANWTDFNSIGGGVFCSSGGNGYFLNLDRPYASNSSNRIAKVVGGTKTTLTPTLSGVVWAIGDKLGLLGEEVGGTVTLTIYRNPTGYDGDGFPTDGSVASTTDTDLTTGTVGLVAFRGSGTTAFATDAYFAGTSVSQPSTVSVDTDNDVIRGQQNVVIATSNVPGTLSSWTAKMGTQGGTEVALTPVSRAGDNFTVHIPTDISPLSDGAAHDVWIEYVE